MLKQLEKRFDKKLHEQVLERLNTEVEKLEEALEKERTEREDLEERTMRENENFLEEHKDELVEKLLIGDVDNPEVEPTFDSKAKKESEGSEDEGSPADAKEVEMPTEEELHEIEEKSTETNEENKVIEPMIESVEQMTNPEPAAESEIGVNEIDSLENPVEIGIEQLQDLEPILDQIEPIEPGEMKLVEKGAEIAPEIQPENIEEEPVEEGETY
jgi:hypothetical protein